MKDIISTLNLVQRLACNLEAEKVSAIERDLALEKLRAIYDLLLGTAVVAEQEPIQDSVIELIEDLVEEVEEFDENDDEVVEDEPTEEEPVTEEPAEEPEESVIELIEDLVEEVEEFANEDEPEVEEQPEEEKEEVVAESATAPKTKLAHSAILALYDDDDEEESAPAVEEEVVEKEIEEEVVVDMAELEAEMESAKEEVAEVAPAEEKAEEEIVEEQAEDEVVEEKAEESATEPMIESVTKPVVEPAKVVLGDVLGAEQTTLADRIAATATVDVASAVSASKSLGEMIGLNDKFILLRDLFQNNHDYYEAAIDQLDEFDNIDDAMFFIHDNFQWNPNSEGAKLLVELLSNKLL